MFRRASRGVVVLAKSRLRNMFKNVLSEKLFLSLYPPVDRISQQAAARAEFNLAKERLRSYAASNNNNNEKKSSEADTDDLSDLSSWTLETVNSGKLSVKQLMALANDKFYGERKKESKSTPLQIRKASRDKNDRLAVAAWTQASKLGDAEAIIALSICYARGVGVEQDEKHAFSLLYSLAHDRNDLNGHVSVFLLYVYVCHLYKIMCVYLLIQLCHHQ